jgi:hypothetical protein
MKKLALIAAFFALFALGALTTYQAPLACDQCEKGK